ncbi:MAG: anthranilate synthase component I family protein [Brevundimonas sp.]|uniref:Anthranilate synthase component I family protein n=1 Tax=Brevundimonas albigilva TaxID=1312364 RepID=A0ABY4SLS7_9CAUL|nr:MULTISPECIES: anthranilate synthase component I family protein [Brevundimonas]MCV0414678.1 anthranilate synthase component I family protein [Brevundimonas sp.]URI15223.1 anthranilate synthase component I family protein [Brevundimonas albigilva]
MSATGETVVVLDRPWTDPVRVAAGLGGGDGALVLLSDGGPGGRWSHVATGPDRVHAGAVEATAAFAALRDPAFGPGTVGLAAYDAGARPATGPRAPIWPDLMLARYPAMLSFDHQTRTVRAIGRGRTTAQAEAAARRAAGWLARAATPAAPAAPAETFAAEAGDDAYRAAVADVVARIAAGELFQANVARAWGGRLRPGADPFDAFLRLQQGRASPFGAYWRIGARALVSNSPELFLAFQAATGRIEARPIKGTRPRAADPAEDAARAADLLASAKDRAENLMIVDLMRNDLARVSQPGSVRVEALFAIERHPTVHHLVSTVTARAAAGVGPADLLEATFPPGSITGAPKHQAMKVIAAHEPPRGPWCGSLFLIEEDGGLTASVLIRTAAFEMDGDGGWRFRTLAGAGIVADSDPAAELAETDAKIAAIRQALAG